MSLKRRLAPEADYQEVLRAGVRFSTRKMVDFRSQTKNKMLSRNESADLGCKSLKDLGKALFSRFQCQDEEAVENMTVALRAFSYEKKQLKKQSGEPLEDFWTAFKGFLGDILDNQDQDKWAQLKDREIKRIERYIKYVYTVVLAEEKRLLLNDPDVLVNRLNRLENVMVVLNSTVLQQSITIQQQSLTIQQQQTSIHQQELTIKQLQDTIKNSQSYVGGGIYSDSGAAAEYVCLPPDPNYVKTSGGDYGRMYGGEFDSNFFSSNSDNEDVPCALCRTNRASSVIMIPGKNTCHSGWKVEYHGYLASGFHNHAAASAYVCVDINPCRVYYWRC
ncbi:Hypothetical predicted protein [Mytilus galloprovincialis]|uniref:Uncharacterized protein n=1 Tax=Mytilus galloprovincialis TaxID=29158 RepID=A0A8B6FCK4_MYTGA|nr:Hypothetical predicted protein [Mytilus galloprovincialis]